MIFVKIKNKRIKSLKDQIRLMKKLKEENEEIHKKNATIDDENIKEENRLMKYNEIYNNCLLYCNTIEDRIILLQIKHDLYSEYIKSILNYLHIKVDIKDNNIKSILTKELEKLTNKMNIVIKLENDIKLQESLNIQNESKLMNNKNYLAQKQLNETREISFLDHSIKLINMEIYIIENKKSLSLEIQHVECFSLGIIYFKTKGNIKNTRNNNKEIEVISEKESIFNSIYLKSYNEVINEAKPFSKDSIYFKCNNKYNKN